MALRTIGGVEYEYDDLGDETRLRRYDAANKTWVEIYCPKNSEPKKNKIESEIMRILSEIYIRGMLQNDED